MSTTPCRCGRQTPTSHPCHGRGYTCPNEASERFYFRSGAYFDGHDPDPGDEHEDRP